MCKIYWLDDYRKVVLDLKQRLARIETSKARIRQLKEEMIKDIKDDKSR